MPDDRAILQRVHELRLQSHWGKRADTSNWPAADRDWRQVDHGAPFDTNVIMARWHLDFAKKLQAEGLLK